MLTFMVLSFIHIAGIIWLHSGGQSSCKVPIMETSVVVQFGFDALGPFSELSRNSAAKHAVSVFGIVTRGKVNS